MVLCAAACSSDHSDSASTSNEVSSTAQKQETMSIAAFLRGPAPDEAAAKAFEQGMELAAESNSPAGVKRTLLSRTQGAPNDTSVQSLLASGTVPLVVYWQTADLAPAAAYLKQANILAVPVWNVTEKVAALGTNVFGFGYSTEQSFAEFARFAGKKLKSYRFGVISSTAEPFDTQSKAFIEEAKSQGNTIVFNEVADSAGADFAAIVARAKNEQCDTIFAALPNEALVAFIKAVRSATFSGKILVGDSFFEADRVTLGHDAEGIYLLQAWSDNAALKARYSAKYGVEPDGITLGATALGYDLITCIEEVRPFSSSEAISHAWLSKPCEGITGKTQFSGERIAQRQKRILTVKGESFVVAE